MDALFFNVTDDSGFLALVDPDVSPDERLGTAIFAFILGWAAMSVLMLPFWIWGLVVRYLEGRRASDLLLGALSCSFIVASGIVKDVGRWLMQAGVDEYGWRRWQA